MSYFIIRIDEEEQIELLLGGADSAMLVLIQTRDNETTAVTISSNGDVTKQAVLSRGHSSVQFGISAARMSLPIKPSNQSLATDEIWRFSTKDRTRSVFHNDYDQTQLVATARGGKLSLEIYSISANEDGTTHHHEWFSDTLSLNGFVSLAI